MAEPDSSLPQPDERTLWRGERLPAAVLLSLSFSVVTTGVGFVVAYHSSDLRRGLLHPISVILYVVLIVSVLHTIQWSRTRYEITNLRASFERGGRRYDVLLRDLSSITVEQGNWTGGIGLSSMVVRSPDAELRWTWILNAEDAVASLDRVVLGGDRALEVVRQDRRCLMYVPVELGEMPASPQGSGSVVAPMVAYSGTVVRFRVPIPVLVGPSIVMIVLAALVVVGHYRDETVNYPPNDAIYPNGVKRSKAEIVAFMKDSVLPFARRTIGPLVGGEEKVTCETCHGALAKERHYRMPAVKALPEPRILETIGDELRQSDSQVQTAVYGYLAAPKKLETMRVMREVVLPGMAELLGRPAYDFTRPLAYNRRSFAFGCYHCHRLDDRSGDR